MSAASPPAGFSVELLERVDELPAVAATCEELCALLAQPGVLVDAIARLLGTDPGLATRVLRLANSGAYAVPGGVFTLQRAVSVVGFTALYQLAIFHQTRLLLSVATRPAPARLVLHGRVVAALATQLATEAGVQPPGLWLSSLLHDLGHHVLYAVAPELFPRLELRIHQGATLLEAEDELIGLDHTAIGLWVGTRWRYPAPLLAAIGEHHAPLPAPDAPPTIASLVGRADRWSAVLGFPGFEIDAAPTDPATLGLAPDPDGSRAAVLRAALQRDGVL